MYGLLDCNNFYVSCERVFRPDLNGKPVVVLSNNDGCVIARSDEAKKLGIPMGAPAFEYESLFSTQKVKVFSSNYALYGDMSSRVMSLISEYAPEMEIYSIDEAFLKFGTGGAVNYTDLGSEIRKKVLSATGIPVSIGFARSKVLSKLANRIAKKFSGHTGNVYVIDSDSKRLKAIEWLKCGDIWGIGHQHAGRLKNIGVQNALQFTQLSDEWIKKEMSVTGLRLKHELSGRPALFMEKAKPKQHIACTRSFDVNFSEYSAVCERVSTYAFVCAEKLRLQSSNCNALMVFIHTNEHRKDLPQYCKNILIHLPYPSNSGIELAKFACEGLLRIFKNGYEYKKAGVIAMDLTPSDAEQTRLFAEKNHRHAPLMRTVDGLNRRLGTHMVRLASQSAGLTWKMRQNSVSPHYTTRINDIITIQT